MENKEAPTELGIKLLHLVTGENVITDISVNGFFYVCKNPLIISSNERNGLELISFSSLVPMFTGESVIIPDNKVVFVMSPNPVVTSFYQQYVGEIILQNKETIATYLQTAKKTKEEVRKHLH